MFLASSPAAARSPAHMQESIDLFMREMDTDGDGQLFYHEMKTGLQRWLRDVRTDEVLWWWWCSVVACAQRRSVACITHIAALPDTMCKPWDTGPALLACRRRCVLRALCGAMVLVCAQAREQHRRRSSACAFRYTPVTHAAPPAFLMVCL